jgi:hypothetical protein
MKVTVDPFCPGTAYADLRDDEPLSHELRQRAIERAVELAVENLEFWRSPYGTGPDRMAGFIELARVATKQRSTAPITSNG